MDTTVVTACEALLEQARAVVEQFTACEQELATAQATRDLASQEAKNLMAEAEKVSTEALEGAISEGAKASAQVREANQQLADLDTAIAAKQDELKTVQQQLADALARLDETRTAVNDLMAKGDAAVARLAATHDALDSAATQVVTPSVIVPDAPVIETAPAIVIPDTPAIVVPPPDATLADLQAIAPAAQLPAETPPAAIPMVDAAPSSTEPPAGTPLTDEELERLTAPDPAAPAEQAPTDPAAASATVGGL